MDKKLLIFSAPSGSGKSTIINWLMQHEELHLAFSISCTSRAPRGTEQNGVEYFFLSAEEFRQRIANDEFLEYEEVYKDRFYGTLKQQVENQLAKGENVVFDLDVKGGCNIKLAGMLVGREIEVWREMPKEDGEEEGDDEDVLLSEFNNEIDPWVIERLQSIGCDTAKSVLALDPADIAKRADLEDETVEEVVNILRAEFEEE